MKSVFIILFIALSQVFSVTAQEKYILDNTDNDKIRFKLINNLIVIPIEINGVELSFLLDSGVSKPILFNFFNLEKDLKMSETETILLRGLGEGESIEALRSRGNTVKLGNAKANNQDVYAIYDESLNFAPRLGVPVHGIIGYDIFRDFIVEINYSSKFLVLHKPNTYNEKKCRKCKVFDLEFYNRKPFINGHVVLNNERIPVKLLIDTGGSDALWLFADEDKGIKIPEKFFDDFLGKGLSGTVNGKRSRISELAFSDFQLKNINVAFPDSLSIAFAKNFKERNGSIGGEVLRRFNVIFDYQGQKIILKKNRNFKAPFYYNKSGIVLQHNGVRIVKQLDSKNNKIKSSYGEIDDKTVTHGAVIINLEQSYKFSLVPSFEIIELRKESPAEAAGLQVGDIILRVNGKGAHQYSLPEINQMFYGENGKRIRMLIDRNGIQMKFTFHLKDLL